MTKRRMMTRALGMLVAAFCFLSAPLFLIPQESSRLNSPIPDDELVRKLEKKIPRMMESALIPGLSIALIWEGNITWTRGFGIKNALTKQPVDAETIFEAASLTKPLFAYYVMQLVDEGLINLDKPLVEYIPREKIEKNVLGHSLDLEGFKLDWFKKITTRLILSHSAGMPHGERGTPYPLLFEPGSRFKYSAGGYWYLQQVIEHLKGKRLAPLIKENVLAPLGMRDSSMVWEDRYEEMGAVGHDLANETTGRFRKRTRAHAAASLYTTAGDYARFVIAVMKGTGLNAETARTMLSPQIDVDNNLFWSLGFGIERFPFGDAFWQWGDYGIFRNYITAFRKQKTGLVYLTNSFNGLSIGPDLVKTALGFDDRGLAYLDYDRFDSPPVKLAQLVVNNDADMLPTILPRFISQHKKSIDERVVNRLGYSLLNGRKFRKAIALFLYNVQTYPLSANCYDSLAEAYMRSGDGEKAIAFYQKTLEAIPKDPRPDREYLENLKKGAESNLARLKKK